MLTEIMLWNQITRVPDCVMVMLRFLELALFFQHICCAA